MIRPAGTGKQPLKISAGRVGPPPCGHQSSRTARSSNQAGTAAPAFQANLCALSAS